MVRAWNKLKAIQVVDDQAGWRKKLLSRTVLFGVLFSAVAAGLGVGIGTSGAETHRFVTDLQLMSTIGDRISKARDSAALTVPAQIDMYKSIEADVSAWDSVLRRVRAEADVYNSKYPDQNEGSKIVKSVEIGLKRADLLRQQIAIAKEIEPLESNARWNAWRTRMEPLIDSENTLDAAK